MFENEVTPFLTFLYRPNELCANLEGWEIIKRTALRWGFTREAAYALRRIQAVDRQVFGPLQRMLLQGNLSRQIMARLHRETLSQLERLAIEEDEEIAVE
jgi:hypothetical protein